MNLSMPLARNFKSSPGLVGDSYEVRIASGPPAVNNRIAFMGQPRQCCAYRLNVRAPMLPVKSLLACQAVQVGPLARSGPSVHGLSSIGVDLGEQTGDELFRDRYRMSARCGRTALT